MLATSMLTLLGGFSLVPGFPSRAKEYVHMLYTHIFIYISTFKYCKPVVHWYPWFQTNTTGLNKIFSLPFHICDFFFWQWEIWLSVFIPAFLCNPCPMHVPDPSHWLGQPVWSPSFPHSRSNPLRCSVSQHRSPPHRAWARKLTLGPFPTSPGFLPYLIWAAILHLGPLTPLPSHADPLNGFRLNCLRREKLRADEAPEKTLARRDIHGSCQQIECLCMKSFTSHRLWLHLYPHMIIGTEGLSPVRNIHEPAKFQLWFCISPLSDTWRFPCFHFELDSAYKTLVLLYPAYLWVCNAKNVLLFFVFFLYQYGPPCCQISLWYNF